MAGQKRQSKKITYAQVLKGEEKGFCANLCNLEDQSFDSVIACMIVHADTILKEIREKRYPRSIEEFMIGKTHAKKLSGKPFDSQDIDTWNVRSGIEKRCNYYLKKKDYDFLIVLYGFTKDFILGKDTSPGDDSRLCNNQHFWALSIEQQLIHHFAMRKSKEVLGNESVESGGRPDNRTACGVVYIAIKLQERPYKMPKPMRSPWNGNRIQFDEFLKGEREGYCAHLCADLKRKPLQDAANCLKEHCSQTHRLLENNGWHIKRFAIGQSHATHFQKNKKAMYLNTKDFETWRVADGIAPLWNNIFRKQKYNGLVVLSGTGEDDLPTESLSSPMSTETVQADGDEVQKINEPQHVYVRDLHKILVKHFEGHPSYSYCPADGSESKKKGKKKGFCGVIYMAVELEKRTEGANINIVCSPSEAESEETSKPGVFLPVHSDSDGDEDLEVLRFERDRLVKEEKRLENEREKAALKLENEERRHRLKSLQGVFSPVHSEADGDEDLEVLRFERDRLVKEEERLENEREKAALKLENEERRHRLKSFQELRRVFIIGDSIIKNLEPIDGTFLKAFPGATIGKLTSLLEKNTIKLHNCDHVIVHIGTNDIGSDHSVEDILCDYAYLFAAIRKVKSSISIICSAILPRPLDHDKTDIKIREVNEKLEKEMSKDLDFHFIRSYSPFCCGSCIRRYLFAKADGGLHLNIEGARHLRDFFIGEMSVL